MSIWLFVKEIVPRMDMLMEGEAIPKCPRGGDGTFGDGVEKVFAKAAPSEMVLPELRSD